MHNNDKLVHEAYNDMQTQQKMQVVVLSDQDEEHDSGSENLPL